MKKILFIIFGFLFCIGCSKNNSFIIEDRSKDIEGFVCAEALEEIYRDDKYVYLLNCMKSSYIVVKYDDGREENIKDALKNGNVLIDDLNKFNITYYKNDIN